MSLDVSLALAHDSLDYERLSITNGAVGGPAAAKLKPSGRGHVKHLLVVVETGTVRWTVHGTDPSATVGAPIAAGGNVEIAGHGNCGRLKLFADGVNAVVHVYYGY